MASPALVRPARAGDAAALAAMEAELFAGRRGRAAARLRQGAMAFAPGCLVAEQAGVILGAVSCYHMVWRPDGAAGRPLLWLGPLMVARARQGEGLGRRLLGAAVQAAKTPRLAVALVGDLDYYAPMGFVSGPGAHWRLPGPVDPARVLLRAGDAGAWGVAAVVEPAPAALAA